jgi:hypothetical protein
MARLPRKRGRPYVYSLSTVILRCFIVRIWFKIDSNNALHIFLNVDCQYNRRLVLVGGLVSIQSRRTFDRRLKTISTIDIKQRISTMGHLFVEEGLVDLSITAIDSTLIKANGLAQIILYEERDSTLSGYRYRCTMVGL